MSKTKIEWSEFTWNPVTGCSKVSAGCKFCFAERMARRLAGRYGYPEAPNHFDVTLRLDRLDIPLRRKKPTMYFVCSMSDLFHEEVPTPFIADLWDIMAKAYQHTFQILTKRADRLPEVFHYLAKWKNYKTPLSNVWLGVSVENQAMADERIPLLLQTPAAVRFVSVEPMLEPIQFYDKARRCATLCVRYAAGAPAKCPIGRCYAAEGKVPKGINWVICGGESGPGARPMHPGWARSLRDQCQAAGVPFFFKQWGGWVPNEDGCGSGYHFNSKHVCLSLAGEVFDGWMEAHGERIAIMAKASKKAAGRLLDGREWNEIPEVLDDA